MALAWRSLTTLDISGQDVVKAGRGEQVTILRHEQSASPRTSAAIWAGARTQTCRAIGLGFGIWYLHKCAKAAKCVQRRINPFI